jgi:hypothetical protein
LDPSCSPLSPKRKDDVDGLSEDATLIVVSGTTETGSTLGRFVGSPLGIRLGRVLGIIEGVWLGFLIGNSEGRSLGKILAEIDG